MTLRYVLFLVLLVSRTRDYLLICEWPGADASIFISISCSERDTTGQLIGNIDDVIGIVTERVDGSIDWAEACRRLPAYDGVQAVE